MKQEIRQLRETVAQYQVLQTAHPHIIRIPGVQGGEPIVRDAYVTVRTIVEQTRLGTTSQELLEGHPPLTLAGIYDALSYYYDHKEEMDQIIEENRQALERLTEFSKRIVKKV
ncbi:MAG: DUF433 domain-containing protein [Chloroflexi bacterium]|nr:DUF433 domain-containing protein [Chloroflexota bacterium]